jgi:hypothetical protein
MTDAVEAAEGGGSADSPLVRPYALTGGRTRHAGNDLAIEAVVVSTELGERALDELALERGAIVRWCASPTSIAELAGRLGAPLGVVRVLVGDLSVLGLVDVHPPAIEDLATDRSVLERVLAGLEALS